jgi:hypothetical protein
MMKESRMNRKNRKLNRMKTKSTVNGKKQNQVPQSLTRRKLWKKMRMRNQWMRRTSTCKEIPTSKQLKMRLSNGLNKSGPLKDNIELKALQSECLMLIFFLTYICQYTFPGSAAFVNKHKPINKSKSILFSQI